MKRADVLDVAMHAYWEEGPDAVSLNAICQKAEVSKPSVYREFGNEDGLTCAVLETYTEVVLAKMQAVLDGPGSFAWKIDEVARLAAEDALHTHGCLWVKMRAVKPQLGERTQGLVDLIQEATLAAFTRVLTEAQASGEWQGGIAVPLAAQYLHAQIGLALDMRGRGEDPRDVLAMALSVFRGNTASGR
ncbi:TetR/AcrR family transcriptional regulator [Anianabacter salinae]|uniref:TetR/AcrR family transcriptional regulator n=1 Tax=Anianabacter salinae TaxID=2851023 RepID=UPI00225E3CA5|nr:TetR/AcrR family transcriptional regulator [Anianabacter salinae]MBV0911657.1 TetR/AcrR family transcriptional regulator [Anianabacter salinae]